jgi:small subunit ribosomal protein S4e
MAAPIRLPLAKKGTKYLVRPRSHTFTSVSVLIAVRDMLKIAATTREVKQMIHNKQLKINGNIVRDFRESIKLFNVFEADKAYSLSILPTGKFTLIPHSTQTRLVKIISRKLVSGNVIQVNLHDGTNIVGKKDQKVGDSLVIDFKNAVKDHIKLEKGASVFIAKGSLVGRKGKIESLSGKEAKVKVEKEESTLPIDNLFVQ